MPRTGKVRGRLTNYAARGQEGFPVREASTCRHAWIYGTENAVCSQCGYLLPKSLPLPETGFCAVDPNRRELPPDTKQNKR